MLFACDVIMVAIDRNQFGLKCLDEPTVSNGLQRIFHHYLTINASKVLRPFHRENIIVKDLGSFR